jgi:hypothetical protein
MIFRYKKEPEAFLREYNQQRWVEAFFSNIKRRFGPSVKSRIGTMRRREVWMRCLIMNILVAAGEVVERETAVAKKGVLETVPLVFAMKDHTKPVGATLINSWTKRIMEKTGVQFTPHGLRRTYGQMLLDRGVDIQTVSLMLGHGSTNTTERHYCRKNEDDARTEVLEAFRQSPSTNSPKLTPRNELAGYA